MRTLLVLFAAALPAAACINDGELITHEREFRSSYGAPAAQPETLVHVPNWALFSGGGALLVGGFVAAARPRKALA